MTRWFYVSVLLTVAAFASSFYLTHYRFDDLPAQVPIHWNIRGQADGFVPKDNAFLAFLLLPGVMAVFTALTPLLPRLSPRQFEVDRFRNVYGYVMTLVVALMGYIHAVAIWEGINPQLPLDRILVGGLCAFFLLIGLELGKVKRNFWMGVRTPWTLANDAVWEQTHRLAGWLFAAAGVFGVLIAVVNLPVWICFIGILAAALMPVVYSLVLYKRMQWRGQL